MWNTSNNNTVTGVKLSYNTVNYFLIHSLAVYHDDLTCTLILYFYCATLCVTAVFAVAQCPSIRLSVRLSVTFVYCIQMDTTHARNPILRETPSAGAQNRLGVGKICDFRLK